MQPNIFLIGLMGVGKSTLGKQLSTSLEYTFLDTDEIIQARSKATIQEIFDKHGEEHFRSLERRVLLDLQLVRKSIIATGGGMPCFLDNMDIMNQQGLTIWLDEDLNILDQRLSYDKENRPLLESTSDLKSVLKNMYESRKNIYEKSKIHIQQPTLDKVQKKIEVYLNQLG